MVNAALCEVIRLHSLRGYRMRSLGGSLPKMNVAKVQDLSKNSAKHLQEGGMRL